LINQNTHVIGFLGNNIGDDLGFEKMMRQEGRTQDLLTAGIVLAKINIQQLDEELRRSLLNRRGTTHDRTIKIAPPAQKV
jgi:hypothetical protein